jgi:putative ABC transport system permease protein
MIRRLSTTRLCVRSHTRSPGLSAIAVVASALGIGLTTATFSILDGDVVKGLPIENANELVHMDVSNLPAGINSVAVSIHDRADWRAAQRSFTDIAAFFFVGTVNLAGPNAPAERYSGAFATASEFELGRTDFGVKTSSMFNDGHAVELMSPRWRLRPFARHA